MDITSAVEFARARTKSVLTTMRKDGRPQLSNVLHWVGEDDVVRISITADRAKYANLRREPWAALHVTSDDFWSYAVLEGPVDLSPVAADVDDDTVAELVRYYRAVTGEHPDWAEYRRAMVADRRAVVRLTPSRVYGMVR